MKSQTIPFLIGLWCVSFAAIAETTRPDLADQVVIRRTAYGVPHLLAENERALGFGMGYVQAEDHAENILRSIVRARGEQAATFGPGEKNANVEDDFWNRQYRVHARAVETYHKLDPDWRDLMEGYAAGFNYWMRLHPGETPAWADDVTPHDLAAHGMTGVMRFAFNRGRIVEQFRAKIEKGEDAVVSPGEADDMGSNMWAFAPERSESGKAILLGNPHQPWSPVATYYEAHVTIPGKLNFYGTTFVGRPVLTTGFNDKLGWSHTVNYPDLEEIYALERDPEKKDHYRFDGSAVPMRAETHTVRVRTNRGFDQEKRKFWYTPLGPVVHEDDAHIYVLKSAVWDEYRFYQQWYRLGQARNFDEFKRALEIQAIPMFNICYADVDGNIFYVWNGTVPDIPHPNQSAAAVLADSSDDVWTRFHALDELPQWTNPRGGYVFNSNSPPYFTNLHAPRAREDFPAHFPANNLSLRSQHSLALIHNDEPFSLEEVVARKHSMRALLADRVKDDLVAAVESDATAGEEVRAAAELLARWDNTVSRESRGGMLFQRWWDIYAKGKAASEQYAEVWDAARPVDTPRGLADPEGAVTALASAVTDLNERYGRWDMAWGEVHRLRFDDGTDLPLGGADNDLGAFRIIRYREADDGKLVAYSGDSAVMAIEFSNPPRAYSVVAYSQSEIVDAPHYSDQAELFADNRMKPVAFTEQQIQDALIAEYHPGDETAQAAGR